MTDTVKLKEAIKSRGVKTTFLAKAVDMTPQGFFKKLNNSSDFKAWQMLKIVDVLHLSNDEAREIFFAQNVDGKSTK